MSKVDFYHLQNSRLEEVLPKLLEKAYGLMKKVIVKIGTEERVDFLNATLWAYSEASFLPHGSKKDGDAAMQPIWLTSDNDNPNNAEFLFLVDGASASVEQIAKFERIFYIFDGNIIDSLNASREFWKKLKTNGDDISYWQQVNGSWQQKG